ncbi:hypothetical protein ACWIUD_06350 [Helicobacter sp. 23-1044]
MSAYKKCLTGGGILGFVLLCANLNAIELKTLCPNNSCDIKTPQSEITNSTPFSLSSIVISSQITNFINHSTITTADNQTFNLNSGGISNLTNYGTISGGIILSPANALGTITNYGEMRGVWSYYSAQNITLNNLGIIKTNQGSYINTLGNNAAHFALESRNANLTIQNYTILINENATEFNDFRGYTDKTNNKNSHLIIQYNAYTPTAQNVRFKDGKSKILLDFDADFEFGATYNIDKIVTDRTGGSITALGLDFSRLTTRSELYTLTQSGNNFIVNLASAKEAGYSTIGTLYKSNIRTMNNFSTISESLIYPHKYKGTNRTTRKRVIRRIKKVSSFSPSLRDSALAESWQSTGFASETKQPSTLKSNESFFYKSNSLLIADSQSTQSAKSTRTIKPSVNPSATQNYYFILTPFVNHNYFFESGRYNLSGLEYGFVTAFSGKLNNSNSLGTHFVFSYASLNDKDDSIFNITSMNLNLGLNYKLDLIYAMYIKARIDGYYFMNEVKSISIRDKIKPNTIGFGASVSYGKDWDFNQYGILGLSGGVDYKGLYANEFIMSNMADLSVFEKYNKQLYNLLYLDLALDYNKYFNTNIGLWGLNTKFGIKGNITNNALSKSKVFLSNNRSVDMIVDNDKVLGYANISGSYVLNTKNFDMEFSIAYYGNFGDRIMSNGGGFEWRVGW